MIDKRGNLKSILTALRAESYLKAKSSADIANPEVVTTEVVGIEDVIEVRHDRNVLCKWQVIGQLQIVLSTTITCARYEESLA